MSQLTDIFGDIADAIRGKNGSSDTYTPAQMAGAIDDIPSGGGGGTAQITDSVYFKPGETDHGAGDYIAVSTDGENWTEYYYNNIAINYAEFSFVRLMYNSPKFCFYNNCDDIAMYDGEYYSKQRGDNYLYDRIVEIPWQTMFSGKIDRVRINPTGPLPRVNGNLNDVLDISLAAEEVTE